ncbi:hypothetical protein BDV06DRAFT_221189 [Aspergillus oleicola]
MPLQAVRDSVQVLFSECQANYKGKRVAGGVVDHPDHWNVIVQEDDKCAEHDDQESLEDWATSIANGNGPSRPARNPSIRVPHAQATIANPHHICAPPGHVIDLQHLPFALASAPNSWNKRHFHRLCATKSEASAYFSAIVMEEPLDHCLHRVIQGWLVVGQ